VRIVFNFSSGEGSALVCVPCCIYFIEQLTSVHNNSSLITCTLLLTTCPCWSCSRPIAGCCFCRATEVVPKSTRAPCEQAELRIEGHSRGSVL